MKCQSDNSTTIQFEVEDTGIGIAENQLLYIFERFFQVAVTNTRKFGGTGLGLAISKGLVEIMGGQMWTESQLDVGSKFVYTCQFDLFET